jgi:Zn-dependent protease with chaperone function
MSVLALAVVLAAVGLGVAWSAGGAVFPAWTWLLRRHESLGRLTVLASTIPLLLGLAAVGAVLLPGASHLSSGGCHVSLPGWTHLCPSHPDQALDLLLPAMAVLFGLLPGGLRRLAVLLREPVGSGAGLEPTLLDLPQPTAMLVGWLRPSLAVDRRFWAALEAPHRQAVLAHERAHLSRRDPLVLMVLRTTVLCSPAGIGRGLVRAWLDGAERQADAVAAGQLGSATRIAEALLSCAKMGGRTDALVASWGGGALERRIEALLVSPVVPRARGDAGWLDMAVVFVLSTGVLAAAPWLHHQIEHLANLTFASAF